ncbi:MAG: tRNA dihydrouridine synthase DusB [Acidobacteria bacterium]|nr:tRNA dihydrouridine synthase DusB [Acidobacteriota bacterium]
MFKIGDVGIDPPLVLAPVAGHTDTLFRQAIKQLGGCGLVVSELVSTEGMTRHQERTLHLTRFDESERPISLQVFGSDPDRMAESARIVEEMGADIVDINLGCPVKKVVKQGGGSNLLRDLPLLRRIFKAVRGAIRAPLTVKIRSGWDRDSINAVEVLKLAEDCGIQGIAVHGRTRCDMFRGRADWSVIARVKENALIPVMGNGDVCSPEDAERMFRETGVDGVMIGRGVLSNPWLIRQCADYLSSGTAKSVTLADKAEFMMTFLGRVRHRLPEPVALGKMKKSGGCLSKGIPGGARLRERLNSARTVDEFLSSLSDFLSDLVPRLPARDAQLAESLKPRG